MAYGDLGAGLGGAIGGIIGLTTGPGGGEDEYKKAVKLWEAVQEPEFDMRELQAPELELLAEYFPETYDAVVPQEVKLIQDSPAIRQEQEASLGVLSKQAQEGIPLGERLAAERSQDILADESNRQFQSGQRNLAQRGRLSGGAAAGLAASRGQTAANLARGMGSDLTGQAVENRYRAALAAGDAAGRLRQQDIGVEQSRGDATNRFNEIVSQLSNQAARDNFMQRVAANQYMTGTQQRLGEQNALNRYGTDEANLTRQNALRQQEFQNRSTKAQGQTGALGDLGYNKDLQQAAYRQNVQEIGRGLGGAAGSAVGLWG